MVNLSRLIDIACSVPVDIGGGSSFEKTALMAALADHLNLRTYIEIGVYRGRSFLPIAWSFEQRGGHSFGIDPYALAAAVEEDLAIGIRDVVSAFIQETNWDHVYDGMMKRRAALELEASTTIVREASSAAFPMIAGLASSPMMIHIDGNHDTRFVMEDVKLYASLLKDGDVLVLDDTDWDSVKPALALAQTTLETLYVGDIFTILVKLDRDVAHRLPHLKEQCRDFEWKARTSQSAWFLATTPRVSVAVLTQNHEQTIAQAIQSALDQMTDFACEIVIGVDLSTDRTRAICREFQRTHPDKIRLIEHDAALGAAANYLNTYSACRGDFVAFIEGDNMWTDPSKLQKQADFLGHNPDYAICFHNVCARDASGLDGEPLLRHMADTTTVHDLCTGDYTLKPSCMIRNGQVSPIPNWLCQQPDCDWLFSILNAERGKIKFLSDVMAASRRRQQEAGSGQSQSGRSELHHLMQTADMVVMANHHLAYRYDREFQTYLARLRLRYDALIAHRILAPDVTLDNSRPGAQPSLVMTHDLLFAIGQELARISVRFDRMDRLRASITSRIRQCLAAPERALRQMRSAGRALASGGGRGPRDH